MFNVQRQYIGNSCFVTLSSPCMSCLYIKTTQETVKLYIGYITLFWCNTIFFFLLQMQKSFHDLWLNYKKKFKNVLFTTSTWAALIIAQVWWFPVGEEDQHLTATGLSFAATELLFQPCSGSQITVVVPCMAITPQPFFFLFLNLSTSTLMWWFLVTSLFSSPSFQNLPQNVLFYFKASNFDLNCI